MTMILFSWAELANFLRMALHGKVDTKVRSTPILASVHVDPYYTLPYALFAPRFILNPNGCVSTAITY